MAPSNARQAEDAVFRVLDDRAEEAAEVLAQAFLLESATDFFFPPTEGNKLDKLRALFAWAVAYRMATGLPVLAARDAEGRIAGVATIRTPISVDPPAIVEEMWEDVAKIIGPEADARIVRYDKLQKAHVRREPHHYLVSLGVLPEAQGKGFGGALLRASIRLADEDPKSTGLGLDTASESSQALYARFGFGLESEQPLEDKLIRFMFRPRTASGGYGLDP